MLLKMIKINTSVTKNPKKPLRVLQINAFLAILIIFVLKIGLTISPLLKAVNVLK